MNNFLKIDCKVEYKGNNFYNYIKGPKLKKELILKDSLFIIEHILYLDSLLISDNYKENWKNSKEEYKEEGYKSWKELLIEDLTYLIEGDYSIKEYCTYANIPYEEDFPFLIYTGVSLLKFLQDKEYI